MNEYKLVTACCDVTPFSASASKSDGSASSLRSTRSVRTDPGRGDTTERELGKKRGR